MASARIFWNYSDEDFTGKWDSVPYTVKAGEKILLQDYIAKHLAEHFTMREMNKADKNALINRESPSFQVLTLKALPEEGEVEAETPEKIEMEVVKAKKPGRKKKEKEVEFPDLKK